MRVPAYFRFILYKNPVRLAYKRISFQLVKISNYDALYARDFTHNVERSLLFSVEFFNLVY